MTVVRVAILEDLPVVVDGYRYRLAQVAGVEIVFSAADGQTFEAQLAATPADVVLMDLGVPTEPGTLNPYPVPAALPQLHNRYPNLNVIIVSVLADRVLIETMLNAGATGYLVKSDAEAYERLAEIITIVAEGGQYLSQTAQQLLRRPAAADNGSPLTKRQVEVLALCAAYPDNNLGELAQRLGVSSTTVRNQMSQIYLRLEVRTRHAAVLRAKSLGYF
ncbi:MAG: response regulator transcription factor [Anaerolineales bacterium]|nr:response regulator transcription factor [Anaerolineales bacterium]